MARRSLQVLVPFRMGHAGIGRSAQAFQFGGTKSETVAATGLTSSRSVEAPTSLENCADNAGPGAKLGVYGLPDLPPPAMPALLGESRQPCRLPPLPTPSEINARRQPNRARRTQIEGVAAPDVVPVVPVEDIVHVGAEHHGPAAKAGHIARAQIQPRP